MKCQLVVHSKTTFTDKYVVTNGDCHHKGGRGKLHITSDNSLVDHAT